MHRRLVPPDTPDCIYSIVIFCSRITLPHRANSPRIHWSSCAGVLPAWAFVIVGLSAYIRNFNAIHQSAHTRPDRASPL